MLGAPHPDLVLAGRYRLERELGRGGMGSVWLAEQLTLQSKVAVKLLSPNAFKTDAKARFLSEARAAARVNSPHVVRLFDFGVEGDLAFLVMELLDGETLAARLRRRKTLEPTLAARVLMQVARGMSEAHLAGIVHRDLKPDNIFLVPTGDEVLAKVLDFGIAKTMDSGPDAAPTTKTGDMFGTVMYMSPEQIEDSKRADVRVDIWSFGVIAYECLVGQRPFLGDNIAAMAIAICHDPSPIPSSVSPVPRGFDEWFARACAKHPGRRFATIIEAANELARICGTTGVEATASPLEQTAPTHVSGAVLPSTTESPISSDLKWAPKSKAPLALALGVAIVGFVGALTWFSSRTNVDTSSATTAVTGTTSDLSPPARSASSNEFSIAGDVDAVASEIAATAFPARDDALGPSQPDETTPATKPNRAKPRRLEEGVKKTSPTPRAGDPKKRPPDDNKPPLFL